MAKSTKWFVRDWSRGIWPGSQSVTYVFHFPRPVRGWSYDIFDPVRDRLCETSEKLRVM